MEKQLQPTRDLLLTAATRVFAEHGFKSATIRQISELSGANVAAVNYHFGDKETLYREVFQRCFKIGTTRQPSENRDFDGATAAVRLRAFVEWILRQLVSDGAEGEGLAGRVLAREVLDPSSALEDLVLSLIEPEALLLAGIVRELVGWQPDEATVRLCGVSVVSQVLFYHHCRAVAVRLFPELPAGPSGVELLADHITRFSVAALESFRRPAPRNVGFVGENTSQATETEVHLL